MRHNAEGRGGDLTDYGPLPTLAETDKRYEAAVADCIVETPDSADAVLALVKFAGHEHLNDERDGYHQAVALANAAFWLNKPSITEAVEKERRDGNERPQSPEGVELMDDRSSAPVAGPHPAVRRLRLWRPAGTSR